MTDAATIRPTQPVWIAPTLSGAASLGADRAGAAAALLGAPPTRTLATARPDGTGP